MNKVTDHYATLGLAPGVAITEVRARFRQLAMDVHPDRNQNDPGCQERLKHINAAYEFLSDASRKADYDARYRSEAVVSTPVQILRSSGAAGSSHSFGGSAAYLLALAALCVLVVGLVAFLVTDGLAGPSDNVAPPSVTIIELSPSAETPTPDAMIPVPPASAGTGEGGGALSLSEKSLWPTAPPEPLGASSELGGASPAAPVSTGEWLSPDTSPYPSH